MYGRGPLRTLGRKQIAEPPHLCFITILMSLAELESKVQKLSPTELSAFTRWLDEFASSQWDAQIEQDVASGKLAKLLERADAEFELGKCKEL